MIIADMLNKIRDDPTILVMADNGMLLKIRDDNG